MTEVRLLVMFFSFLFPSFCERELQLRGHIFCFGSDVGAVIFLETTVSVWYFPDDDPLNVYSPQTSETFPVKHDGK